MRRHGLDAGSGHDQQRRHHRTDDDSTTRRCSADELGAEIVGRWAHYDVVAYQDDVLKTLIISYGFNDFSEVDGQIIDQGSFCFSEQRTDQPIETSLSDAATQAIKPPPTPVEVDLVDGVLRVQRAPTPTPVGIRLDDPANELARQLGPVPRPAEEPDDPEASRRRLGLRTSRLRVRRAVPAHA